MPIEPGCYLMRGADQEVIYVGKAKQLRNRVRSYFTGAHNEKTTRLVSEIRDFSYVVTNSEQESLILELNLIKQHTPKYNIRLVDDKTYPFIELTEETHPRLQVVRQKDVKGRIFGPYPNVYSARETARLLNRLYPLRKCDILPKKACLYYHMGQCLAPCIHKVESYEPHLTHIIRFLKGDTRDVLTKLQQEMDEASRDMAFEKAAEFRDMIQHIETTTEKQIINLNDFKDRDAVSYAASTDDVAIQILMMRQGRIVDHHQVVFAYVDEPLEAVMSYLTQFYEDYQPDEWLFDDVFDAKGLSLAFGKQALIPKKGDKKRLVELARKNARHDLEHHSMLYRHQEEQQMKALATLSEWVGRPVSTIEVFDNAQLFGTAPISALIVYGKQGFDKKQYRKYHLKTTTNDDLQAMREVTYRRYQRLLVEGQKQPDLILVDGGLNQLAAARETLDALGLDIPVAGLQKNQRHQLEALVIGRETKPLVKHSQVYKLLGRLSEEVHRFAIDFHRKTRSKQTVRSPLDDIPGIGEARKKAILNRFKSLDELKNATTEELAELGIPVNVITNIKEVIS